MDNEMENRENTDEVDEFEIPDISAVSEELGISDERPERSEPTPKTSQKKKTESKAEEGEWAIPTEDGPNAEHKPKKKKRKPKKKPREEIAVATDNTSDEVVESGICEPDEVIADVEAVAEGDAATEGEAATESEATTDGEAANEGDAVAEAASSNTNEDEAPVFVPREYKFPDDALSPSIPADEDFPVMDLLGDPLTDEVYVAEEMKPAPISDPAILPEEQAEENEDASPKDEKYDPEKPRKIDVVFDFVELVIFTLVAVLFFTTFFVKHAVVEGYSMYDTLYPNDVLLISDLFYKPMRGDIVVVEDYTLEREDMHKPLVKRVIATEGQLVKVTKDAIYVNGEMLDEPYVFIDVLGYEYNLLPSDDLASIPGFFANSEHYTFVVPEGEVFVMGDHRNDSTDSRHVGTVREEAILGRALIRIYPFSRFGVVDD